MGYVEFLEGLDQPFEALDEESEEDDAEETGDDTEQEQQLEQNFEQGAANHRWQGCAPDRGGETLSTPADATH